MRGFDISAPSVEKARQNIAARGVADRYTVELRLTYDLADPVTGEPDPSAYVRLYRDARQAETTHCYVGRRWQDTMGLYPPPAELISHRMRMNTFLGKWLQYLAENGHGVATLRQVPADSAAGEVAFQLAGQNGAAIIVPVR